MGLIQGASVITTCFSFFLKYDDKERISDMIAETLSEHKDINKLTESDMEKLADSVRS